MVVRRRVVVLEGASFCVTENKTKGKVDFENRALVSKDAIQLFAEGGRTDRRQAEIVPVL